jgi:hypothetical protein
MDFGWLEAGFESYISGRQKGISPKEGDDHLYQENRKG